MVLPPGPPPPDPSLPPPIFDLPPETLDDRSTQETLPPAQERRPKRPRPDIGQVQNRIEKAVQFWSRRDERMDEDEQLYRLAVSTAGVIPRDGFEGEVVVRNLPYVAVEKVASMVGGEPPTISVVAPSTEKTDDAGRVEEMVRWLWEEWDRAWRRSLHSGLFRDMAHFAALRGWIALRVSYDPEATPPVVLEPVDPRTVYPVPGSRGLRYVAVRRQVTAAEVRDAFPEEAERALEGIEDDEPVTLEAYYDDWWHCVLVDGKPLKEPEAHGYGLVPWVIAVSGGAPIRASEVDPDGWTANVGVPVFHGIKQAYRQTNRLLSQLATEVARLADPPVLFYFDPDEGDEPRELDLSPGAVNSLIAPKERVELIRTSPNPADLGPLLSALNDDLTRGSLPPILWGHAGPDTSGFAISSLSGAARDAVRPITLAMEQAIEDASELALTLIRDFHDRPVGVVVRDRRGRWVAGRSVSPEDLVAVGTRVKAAYRDLAPRDRAAFAQLAALLSDKKLVSLRTAREQYLGLDNPDLENELVLEELIYQDPEIMREYLVPISLARFAPELFEIWLARENRRRAQAQTSTTQPGPGQPGPSSPHPGAVPVPGMPPQPAPPQFGPDLFDALAQAAGAAQGPTGAGPVPPGPIPFIPEP